MVKLQMRLGDQAAVPKAVVEEIDTKADASEARKVISDVPSFLIVENSTCAARDG